MATEFTLSPLSISWPYGQEVKTLPSQGGDRGSIPLRATKYFSKILVNTAKIFFYATPCIPRLTPHMNLAAALRLDPPDNGSVGEPLLFELFQKGVCLGTRYTKKQPARCLRVKT